MFPVMKNFRELFTKTRIYLFLLENKFGARNVSLESSSFVVLGSKQSMGSVNVQEKSSRTKIKPNFEKKNRRIIARILGITEENVRKPPKKLIVEDSAQQVFNLLMDHGFSKGEVLCYPDIFMMSPWATLNYIEIMNESLFASVGLAQILNFYSLQKQSVDWLMEVKITPTVPEIIRNYFDVLKMTKNTVAEDSVWNALPSNTSRLTLKELRQIMIIRYIAWKLNCDHKEVEPIIPKYGRVSHRSLSWIQKCLELLKESNLGKDKIVKHGYLLQANPENTADVLRNIHSLSGIPMDKLLHKRPKILMSPKSSLLEIEELFRLHEISTESILRHPEIYTLSPNTLKERLEAFDSIPEFIPLKKHPRVSRLIYYQNKAKERVEYFRSVNITGASLHLLSMDKTKFRKQVTTGDVRSRGRDILNFFKSYLSSDLDFKDITTGIVRKNIQRQPHWLHATLMNVKESIQYLEGFNVFTKSQIFDALPLTLYPKEKIEIECQAILNSKEAKLTDDYFLHMVLYYLEKKVHFSGHGIWHDNNLPKNIDDDYHNTAAARDSFDSYLGRFSNSSSTTKTSIDREENIMTKLEMDDEIIFGESLQDTLNENNNNNVVKKSKD